MPHSIPTPSLIDRLLVEIERAFEEGHGAARASALADQHPEHAETLVDFVDAMLLGALAPSPDPVASERATVSLADRLEARGEADLASGIRRAGGLVQPNEDDAGQGAGCEILPFAPRGTAREAAPPRRASDRAAALGCCFRDYAERVRGWNVKVLAEKLGVPMRFLRGLDENPSAAPPGALDEMARRAAEAGMDRDESRDVLGAEPEQTSRLAIAASGRDGVRAASAFSYEVLVRSCFQGDMAERDLWLSFADSPSR